MLFSSPIFIFAFLPLVYLVNLKLPLKASNVFLTFVSLLFYAWGEPVYIILLVSSVTINYYLTRMMMRFHKKLFFTISIIFNMGLLVVFKYTVFIVKTIFSITNVNYIVPNIALPFGISFFTFHIMSYIIDVYHGTVKVQTSYLRLMLYISFFPQLVAGPIIKYKDIASQLVERKIKVSSTASGIKRFIMGLSKKLLIANIFAIPADKVFSMSVSDLNIAIAWIGAISYLIQIYFDFSGYSDMAIGLGQMFGFSFPENFNYPYIASSVQDFWKRWHISLTSWFREYLYFPLGGNRKGRLRTSINKLAVFFLTGLWHGANFTFIVWGLFHGLFLTLETYGFMKNLKAKFKPLGHLYTLLVVAIGFVIFRSEDLNQAFVLIRNMFTGLVFSESTRVTAGLLINPLIIVSFIFAVIISTPVLAKIRMKFQKIYNYQAAADIASGLISLSLYLLCILNLSTSSYNPFIYFRF